MPRHSLAFPGAIVYDDAEFSHAERTGTVAHGVSLVVNAASQRERFLFLDPAGGTTTPTALPPDNVDAALRVAPRNSGPSTAFTAQQVPEDVQEHVLDIAALLACTPNAATARLLEQYQGSVKREVRTWKQETLKGHEGNMLFDATHAEWTRDEATGVWSADAVASLSSAIMRALLKNRQLRVAQGRAYSWPNEDAVAALCTAELQQCRYFAELLPRMLLMKLDAKYADADPLWKHCEAQLVARIAKFRRQTAPKRTAVDALFGPPLRAPKCMLRAAVPLRNEHRLALATIYRDIHNSIASFYTEEQYITLLGLDAGTRKASHTSFVDFKGLLRRTMKHRRQFKPHACTSIQMRSASGHGKRCALVCPFNNTVECAKSLGLKQAGRTPAEMAMLTAQ